MPTPLPEDPDAVDYFREYDLREQAHKHELEKQRESDKLARAKSRHDAITFVAGSLSAAGVVIAIIAAIYFGVTGPDDSNKIEQEREVKCIDDGGGWVPKDLVYDGSGGADRGLCVFPRQTVER